MITHNHADHTGGLLVLRRELAKKNSAALSRVHVPRASSIRGHPGGREGNGLLAAQGAHEATGGTFVEHAGPAVVMPGVTMLGPARGCIPSATGVVRAAARPTRPDPEALAGDNVLEDTSLVVDTADVLPRSAAAATRASSTRWNTRGSRCAPPGLRGHGRLPSFAASDQTLAWTAGKLKEFGVRQLMGAHCTGIEAVYRLRQLVGLTRRPPSSGRWAPPIPTAKASTRQC